MDEKSAREKKERLTINLKNCGSLLVAFSGGADSSFLLEVANEVLGDRVLAVTATSSIQPIGERELAGQYTRERRIRHMVFPSCVTALEGFMANTEDRCYHCKRYLFENFLIIAKEKDLRHVAHAANVDDLKDFRPGFRAATELGVLAPLVDVHLGKEEIRFLSRQMGLPTWDKPSMACLASRIPYGIPIEEKNLRMVQEAESFLLDRGFRQVRVRHHGAVAKVEVEESSLKRLLDHHLRKELVVHLRRVGFEHVALDLEGFISGKMNRSLK
jgi:uncharacterized protein